MEDSEFLRGKGGKIGKAYYLTEGKSAAVASEEALSQALINPVTEAEAMRQEINYKKKHAK